MKSVIVGAALLIAVSQSASASGTVSGSGALALAAIVAQSSPYISFANKTLLAKYLNGWGSAPHPAGLIVPVVAGSVQCRSSNVDISHHACTLVFGSVTQNLQPRAAHELYATLIEAGVPSDGAAGSIFEAITNLHCTVNADQVAQMGGGGAHCTYDVQ